MGIVYELGNCIDNACSKLIFLNEHFAEVLKALKGLQFCNFLSTAMQQSTRNWHLNFVWKSILICWKTDFKHDKGKIDVLSEDPSLEMSIFSDEGPSPASFFRNLHTYHDEWGFGGEARRSFDHLPLTSKVAGSFLGMWNSRTQSSCKKSIS